MDKVVEKEVTTTVIVGPLGTARIWRFEDEWAIETRWLGNSWKFAGSYKTFNEAKKAARNEVTLCI